MFILNGLQLVKDLDGQAFEFAYNCEDDYSGGAECFDRPDVVGPIVYHKRNPADYIDLSAFAVPCQNDGSLTGLAGDCIPGTRHYGNLGRNALVGPTYKQWDFALYKNTSNSERVRLQLRAEFFNILNRPNIANPEMPAFIADPAGNLGSCGAASAPVACGFHPANGREVNGQLNNPGYQITATGDEGIGNPFLGGGGPRGVQLAAKFTFWPIRFFPAPVRLRQGISYARTGLDAHQTGNAQSDHRKVRACLFDYATCASLPSR